jgi:cell division protein FtsB
MRSSNVVTGSGGLRLPSKRLLVLLLFGALAGWAAYSLIQESYLDFQLSRQAAQLQQQNDALSAQNDGYRRDTLALQSGSAAEEDARLNGYARSDEKVYLVASPPSPPPPPAARAKATHSARGGGFWSWFLGWLPH